jgi:membrane-associated phospholipid phosphatase
MSGGMVGSLVKKIVLGFAGITLVTYLFSLIIPEKMDWKVLVAINTAPRVPGLDELMLLITDFSMAGLGLLYVCWEITYQLSKGSRMATQKAGMAFKLQGVVLSVVCPSALFWVGYEPPLLLVPLGFFTLAAFWITSLTFTKCSEEELRGFNAVFWLTLLAFLLTELSAEVIIKHIVARPRPFSHVYSHLNSGLRKIPGEVVETGYSYVAGHSSIFFAMITPLLWYTRRAELKGLLLFWATLHAFSRIFLAAHFPYCSLMGSALGFSMATMVVKYTGLWEARVRKQVVGSSKPITTW